MASVEFLLTSKGKPCLVVDGYQHRIMRKGSQTLTWLCLRSEHSKCRGSVKTDHRNVFLSKTDHSCVPNVAEIEVKKVLQNCRKRTRDETSVPVHQIFKEEMTAIYEKGYEFVTETPKYSNVKSSLNSLRRKVLGRKQNPKSSAAVAINEQNDNDFGTPSNPTKAGNSCGQTSRLEQPDHQEPELGYLFPQIFEAGPSSSIVCCPDIILEDQNEHPQSEFESGMSENSSSTSQHQNSSLRPACPPAVGQQQRDSSSSGSRTQIFGWDPLTTFFLSMAQTVRTFPHTMQLELKRKVFELVTEAESRVVSGISDT